MRGPFACLFREGYQVSGDGEEVEAKEIVPKVAPDS